MKLAIIPIGQVSLDALRFIQHGLKNVFPQTETVVLEADLPIPKEAHNPLRRQYNSTHMLTKLTDYTRKVEADRVLGVTEVDLYVPNLNFVFGEAQCPGKATLVSLFRLKPEFLWRAAKQQIVSRAGVERSRARDRSHPRT